MQRARIAERHVPDETTPFRWQQSRDPRLVMRATLCLGASLMVSLTLLSVYVVMAIA